MESKLDEMNCLDSGFFVRFFCKKLGGNYDD